MADAIAKPVRFVPIRRKFLGVILGLLVVSLGVFFGLTYSTFLDDKRLFVLDLNLSVLDSANYAVTLELRSRIEELGSIMQKFYSGRAPDHFFDGLPSHSTLQDEVLRAQVVSGTSLSTTRTFENQALITRRGFGSSPFAALDSTRPLAIKELATHPELTLLNRSIAFKTSRAEDLGIVTVVLPAKSSDGTTNLMVIDLLPDFVLRALRRSEVAEIFLLHQNGNLLAHPNPATMVRFASTKFPHPVVDKIAGKHPSKESFQAEIEKDPHFISFGETPFKDVFVVSQIQRSKALEALLRLTRNSLFLLTIVIWGAVLISRVLVNRLTSNIQKLKTAAEAVGQGDLEVSVSVKSNDEVEKVADSFMVMVKRIKSLLLETAQKARMEGELKTASLVQSTLLQHAELSPDWNAQVVPYYSPASECGGDFWDLQWNGNTVTVVLGDATGHGASAAIIVAVAKSFFSTSMLLNPDSLLKPDEFMAHLNRVIYQSCKGQLLMTMALVQLNTETGEITLCNAGHECPMSIPPDAPEGETKVKPEVFFSRGERLGFSPETKYELVKFKANVGDTVLLYTDGVSEAHDPHGKEFTERKLLKTFGASVGQNIDQVKDSIVSAVDVHRNGAAAADDITFVLLRWQRAVAAQKLAA